MALQDIGGAIEVPSAYQYNGGSAFRPITLDADGEKGAVILTVPKTGTISKIGFRVGTVTKDTNGLDVTVQGVATDGFPDGSAHGGAAAGSTGATSSNTWYWVTLGTGSTVTIGDKISLVVSWTSFDASDELILNIGVQGVSSGNAYPYVVADTGSWEFQSYGGNIAIEYSDNSIPAIHNVHAATTLNLNVFNAGSSPDERGLKFKLPFASRIVGIWGMFRFEADSLIRLYDSDGSTVLEELFIDEDQNSSAQGMYAALFDARHVLTKDTWYRLTYLPGIGTSGRITSLTVTDDGAHKTMGAYPLGVNCIGTSRTDAGAWADVDTERYSMGMLIDQLDDGVGAGGGFIGIIKG